MTIILIIITTVVSVYVFQNPGLFNKLQLSPFMVVYRRQWYRLFSHGFIHATDSSYRFFDVLYFFRNQLPNHYLMNCRQGIITPPLTQLFPDVHQLCCFSSLFYPYQEKEIFPMLPLEHPECFKVDFLPSSFSLF
jgi:hypothetical protein